MPGSHPPDCPKWEYKDHKKCDSVLSKKTTSLLKKLNNKSLTAQELISDSRPVHLDMFKKLAPPKYEYYAGHYRGEAYRCLEFAPVFVGGDPLVGCVPHETERLLAAYEANSIAVISMLDSRFSVVSSLSKSQKLQYLIAASSEIFVSYLTIHPYANGNGHVARLILCSLLGRFNYWLDRWSIHPRPPFKSYNHAIGNFRRGSKQALMVMILNDLLP